MPSVERVPALQGGVDRLDGLESAHVGGDDVGQLAVDLVAGADGDLGALVHHVHLGDDQPLGAVDHVGVAQQRQVEPAAAAGTAGDGAVLLAAARAAVRRCRRGSRWGTGLRRRG